LKQYDENRKVCGDTNQGLKNNMYGIQFNIQVSNSQSPEAETLRGRNDLINFLNNPNNIDTKQPIEGLQKFEHYKVYPIPTSEALTIEYDFVGDNDAEIIIVDILGREALRTTLRNSTNKVYIPIKHLMQGMYMYKISVGKESYTGKIIKQ
jgi:hypothetical protein